MNYRKFFLQCLALAIFVIGTLLACVPSASADGPGEPATSTDPYFREEAPERMVECGNNVFVPLGEGGTWDCPGDQESASSDVIGRLVDCPDGSTGQIINTDLETTCDEVSGAYPSLSQTKVYSATATARTTLDITPTHYVLGVIGFFLTALGTIHMIYRRQTA